MRAICQNSRKWLLALFFMSNLASTLVAQDSQPRPIKIHVDATHAAQKILHAELEYPAVPGTLTLYYPKWMPADHSPDGPIANLAGLKFSANGKRISWRRDLEDMYAVHVNVPEGCSSVTLSLDFLLSAPGPTIDFAASGSANLFILMWNQVLLYPSGRPAGEIAFVPSVRLPEGWKFNTSLPITSQSGGEIQFAVVPLDLLIDSPVQAGLFTRVVPLMEGMKPYHELDIVSDDPGALDIPPHLIAAYERLVGEAAALYQSHHYRDYHFLLTLSDHVLPLGQEHHESSDDRIAERTLADTNARLLEAELFPHEFTHSWNGQFRRPVGLATPDFQQPMKGELLWIYEGLTDYLGWVLTARSGLWTPEEAREKLASIASELEHRAGRSWRSLQDTADFAQVLYFAPQEWASYRRGTDFYIESILLWLEVDVTIRELTHNTRSMNDFCKEFYGGPDGKPVIKTYAFDDVVSTLNRIAPNDWRLFLRRRLDSLEMHAPLGGITRGGWQLDYTDVPNTFLAAGEHVSGTGDFTSSIGLIVRGDGSVQDVILGMAAARAGLCPYMKIMAVNGRHFSVDQLAGAVSLAKSNGSPITLITSNTGTIETHTIEERGGLRGPHLKKISGAQDYLSDILRPLASETAPGKQSQ
jgi:predicted metalloprotease with PDZ domain